MIEVFTIDEFARHIEHVVTVDERPGRKAKQFAPHASADILYDPGTVKLVLKLVAGCVGDGVRTISGERFFESDNIKELRESAPELLARMINDCETRAFAGAR